MTDKIISQNPKRQIAIDKLKQVMNYPGRFPILIIGDSGTGKTHWIKHLVHQAVEFTSKAIFISAGQCLDTKEYWSKIFEKYDNHFLIIEEVEKLSITSQELIFEAMSTENGLYGFDSKNKTLRILFTTTFPIKKIRDDRRYLTGKFFDRISQFVVEFPNFEQTQISVYDDFVATWSKMFDMDESFKDKCPKIDKLIQWLGAEAYRMHGNFRDLDKIVINWNLYQLEGKTEDEILEIIKSEFKHLLHNPSQKIYDDNTFVFIENTNYGDILNDFKMKLKKWAFAMHNNDKYKASKMLGISHRSMERWT